MQRIAYRALLGEPEREGSLERRKCKWYYNIKVDLIQQDERMWTEFIWLRTG
jgi:hypothetical protein